MTDTAYFRTLARYSQWANLRLYDACGKLPEAEYVKPRPSFFGSIHNTLNHILVGDRIWLGRIVGVDSGLKRLDAVLYDNLAALRAARIAEDARVIDLIDGLEPAALDEVMVYRTTSGLEQRNRLTWVLGHFFNHGTHHRGQVHDMLSQTAVAPPELDLIYFLRLAPQPV